MRFLLLILAFLVVLISWPQTGTVGEVIFFDVGQGDAALVRFANGNSILVDAGGGSGDTDRGRRTLVRELARLHVLAPNIVVLSHSDRDHAYGLFGLLESMRIEKIYLHEAERMKPRPLIASLEALSLLRRIPLRSVNAPLRLEFKEATTASVELFPIRTREERNGLQLGADFRVGACRFVLLGDMTEEGERRWMAAHRQQATVLKVSHHGSRTSSSPELLDGLRPRWAVTSCGADNRYGHPVEAVVERFRERRIELLRTDFHGAVRFRVGDDGVVRCETALGSCGTAHCGTSGVR